MILVLGQVPPDGYEVPAGDEMADGARFYPHHLRGLHRRNCVFWLYSCSFHTHTITWRENKRQLLALYV